MIKTTNTTKMKTYTVYITEQAHEIEDVQATTPEQAEMTAVDYFNGGNYENIKHVDVVRICKECDYENNAKYVKCADCGEILK